LLKYVQNWSLTKKYWILFVLCYSGFAALAMVSPQQLTFVVQGPTYNRSPADMSYSVTVAVAGLVVGAFVLAPLAQIVGRTSLIFWCLLATLATQIWAALMTGEGDYIPFIVSRAVCGFFASIPTLLGPSYAMDIFFLHQRGKAFTSFELTFLLGVNVAPTVSGFIVNSSYWTWSFWWTLIPGALAVILVFIFLEETTFVEGAAYKPSRDMPAPFLKNRVATFFPGHKVVPGTTARELVSEPTVFHCTLH
jgi:MFS family permease